MKNVFDIKREKALNFILPKNTSIGNADELLKDTIVVMHLYYAEQVEEHINYIRNIPSEVELLITVSSEYMMNVLDNRLKQLNIHYEIMVKPNRGRDISALLVAAREKILQFKYVCFLHDKKERSEYLKSDIVEWNYCLWENAVASPIYIENILYTFRNNKDVGILAPPSIITENLTYAYENTWAGNFDNEVDVVKKFELHCDIDESKMPIIIGTVFWAKVEAVNKLLKYDWKYEDFDEEPLAENGTLSHAIERVFPFFAQDAGYETGWVMTDEYAAQRIEYNSEVLEMAFEIMKRTSNICNISQMRNYLLDINKILKFSKQFSRIFIYGAGEIGKCSFNILKKWGIKTDGFIVTNRLGNPEQLYNSKVTSLDESDITERDGIIIAVNNKFFNEIIEQLHNRNILDKNICDINMINFVHCL